MKIIMSPSKTQDFTKDTDRDMTDPIFNQKTDKIVDMIRGLSKEQISERLNVKGKLLDETFDKYQNYTEDTTYAPAITAYTGQVFKGLEIDTYNEEEHEYLDNHLFILSALYGVLRPFDRIKPYRLDMKCKVFDDKSLYSFWGNDITNLFSDEELIINVASKEFSRLVKRKMITIEFKEKSKEGKYRTVGTYAKKARGKILNYLIKNKIEDVELIKEFNEDSYNFNKGLSNDDVLVFTR